jgi:beta-carotene hydroxylase
MQPSLGCAASRNCVFDVTTKLQQNSHSFAKLYDMTSSPPRKDLPSLDTLGRDLLYVSRARRALSLATPFVLTATFFMLAHRAGQHPSLWFAALACPVALSFLTYASTSHDLVHRNLHVPLWLNEALLSAVELLAFRSGHAYRAVHINHHAHYPADGDLEGAAAKMSFVRALLEGVTLQYKLWWFALQRPGKQRMWVMLEGITAMLLLAGCVALWPVTHLPAMYAALMIVGSWVYPLATAYIVHVPEGPDEVHQTRLFRGRLLEILALEHLFHLEHHLYPQVPHQNWPKLARRLDPYFEQMGLKPIKLFF